MNIWALIALKNLRDGKSRLKSVLNNVGREQLIMEMFERVVQTAKGSRNVSGVAIVTQMDMPNSSDVVIRDCGGGLNIQIYESVKILQKIGVDGVVVLPCDLPFIEVSDVDGIIECGKKYDAVIAPDKTMCGTNALMLKNIKEFNFGYGVESYRNHLLEMSKRALVYTNYYSNGFSFDLDTPDDYRLYQRMRNITIAN